MSQCIRYIQSVSCFTKQTIQHPDTMLTHLKLTKFRVFLFIIGAILTLLPLACSPTVSPPSTIIIGLMAPLSGELAPGVGRQTLQGAELAVEQVNQAGGIPINGKNRQVVLEVADDTDSPDEAVAVATRLINEKNIVGLVGLPLSRIAIPVSNVAERSRIPMISSWSTNPQTTAGKEFVFRVPFTDDLQAKVIASFAKQELNKQTAAVLYDIASEYNRDLAEFFQQEFTRLGGQVVAFESYTTDQDDFTEQLQRIKDSQAEILFLPNYDNDILIQTQKSREMGIEAQFIGSDTWGGLSGIENPQLEGAFFTDNWTITSREPAAESFIKNYQQTYKFLPTTAAALSYDAINLMLTAIRNQNQADPESIRQGLAKIGTYEGVTGTMQFLGTGDPLRSVVVLQFQLGQPVFYKQVNPALRSND